MEIVTNIFFKKKGKGILLFSGGEKSSKKAAGTLAAVSQTPQRSKGRKRGNSDVIEDFRGGFLHFAIASVEMTLNDGLFKASPLRWKVARV